MKPEYGDYDKCFVAQECSFLLCSICTECFFFNFLILAVEVPSQSVGVALAQSPMQHHVSAQLPTQQHTPQQPHHQSGPTPTSDGRRSKTRTSINPAQLEVLMQTYTHEQRPSKHVREELMAKTGLDMKVWVTL